jgi:hypothetical protein
MRHNQAPTPMFTDVAGNNKKAHALLAGEQRGRWAMVNVDKATGVSVGAPAPVITSTHPGLAGASKRAYLLSLRWSDKAIGADNERPTIRQASTSNSGSNRRVFDSLD